MTPPLSREQIALALFAANLPTQMKEASRWRGAEKIQSVLESGMEAAFTLADIWIGVRNKQEP